MCRVSVCLAEGGPAHRYALRHTREMLCGEGLGVMFMELLFVQNLKGCFMEKTIRLATPADINAIFDIRTSVQENHLSRDQLTEMGITPETIQQAILEAPCAWIAEVDGVPAGFSMADVEDGCVFAAFVLPEYEGHGLGRSLMDRAEAFLFQRHQTIWLETAEASRASGFYRNLGWQPVERLAQGDVRFEKSLNDN